MHTWKDSSGMPLRHLVTTYFNASTHPQTGFFDDALDLGEKSQIEQKQLNNEIVAERRSSFRSETVRCTANPVALLLRHTQIFCNNLPSADLFHARAFASFKQSIAYRHLPPTLQARRWPQSCLLKASFFWSHLSPDYDPAWNSNATQNHMCPIWCYLHALAEAFLVLVIEFSPTGLNISGVFAALCSLFISPWS